MIIRHGACTAVAASGTTKDDKNGKSAAVRRRCGLNRLQVVASTGRRRGDARRSTTAAATVSPLGVVDLLLVLIIASSSSSSSSSPSSLPPRLLPLHLISLPTASAAATVGGRTLTQHLRPPRRPRPRHYREDIDTGRAEEEERKKYTTTMMGGTIRGGGSGGSRGMSSTQDVVARVVAGAATAMTSGDYDGGGWHHPRGLPRGDGDGDGRGVRGGGGGGTRDGTAPLHRGVCEGGGCGRLIHRGDGKEDDLGENKKSSDGGNNADLPTTSGGRNLQIEDGGDGDFEVATTSTLFTSPNIGGGNGDDPLVSFRRRNGLKAKAALDIVPLLGDRVYVDGRQYSIEGGRAVRVFTPGATYSHNGVEFPPSDGSASSGLPIFDIMRRQDSDDDDAVLVMRSPGGDVGCILIHHRAGRDEGGGLQEGGLSPSSWGAWTSLDVVGYGGAGWGYPAEGRDGSGDGNNDQTTTDAGGTAGGGGGKTFVRVGSHDYDLEALNARFRYGDGGGGDNPLFAPPLLAQAPPPLSAGASSTSSFSASSSSSCSQFRVVEVAIAYESSFCAAFGGKVMAEQRVASIVALASEIYMQSGLCLKVQISHLEGFCDENVDPYKTFNFDQSGCGGGGGLLPDFANHWRSNRDTSAARGGAVHLFSGTGMECNNDGSCVIGCAYVKQWCLDFQYGVDWITFTQNLRLQAVLFAHELAHNGGAGHDAATVGNQEFVMYPLVSEAEGGFSAASLGGIRGHIDSADGSCVGPEKQAAPTDSPTASPVTDLPTTASPITDSPTASPITATGAPTAAPTDSPTAFPVTDSPTTASPVTDSPTASPITATDAPTAAPTDSPTASPITDSPTTALPVTDSPTASPVTATDAPTRMPVMDSTTASPVAVPMAPGCHTFALTLTTDAWGSETTWELLDEEGNGLYYSGEGYPDSPDGDTINLVMPDGHCLEPGTTYVFEIRDSFGDGMCCDYGNGGYALTVDGEEYAGGGEFLSMERTCFCVGDGCEGTGCVDFGLDLRTDNFPGETTWEVQNTASGMVVLSGGPFRDDGTNYETLEPLPESQCYTFFLYDSWGDGICCDEGDGWFTATYDAETAISPNVDGEFDFIQSFVFGTCPGGVLASSAARPDPSRIIGGRSGGRERTNPHGSSSKSKANSAKGTTSTSSSHKSAKGTNTAKITPLTGESSTTKKGKRRLRRL